MTGNILALCRAMGAGEEQETLLLPLIQAAQEMLQARLKEDTQGVSAVLPLAVALVAMEELEGALGLTQLTAVTAGQLSLKTGAGRPGEGKRQALRLLAPWLKDTGLLFQGVDA